MTSWIEQRANKIIGAGLKGITQMQFARARSAATTHRHRYLDAYVADLPSVVDLDVIRDAKVHIGVDPLGGASLAYWDAIRERYGLNLEVVNRSIDGTWRFMTVDWDGQIRMDPSSPWAVTTYLTNSPPCMSG